MITFDRLAARPSAFVSLSGLTLTDFEALYQDFAAAYAKDRQQSLTRTGQPRKRAAGGGAQFSQDGRTRLLMALVWLRVYPTYEVLAFFFSLHKGNAQKGQRPEGATPRRGNAQKGVVEVLATLAAHTVFVCERPATFVCERPATFVCERPATFVCERPATFVCERPATFVCERPATERKKLRSVQAVMDAFPDVRLVIDAKEQRVQRPSGTDEKGGSRRKPFSSGKRKAHTLKTQVAAAFPAVSRPSAAAFPAVSRPSAAAFPAVSRPSAAAFPAVCMT